MSVFYSHDQNSDLVEGDMTVEEATLAYVEYLFGRLGVW